MSRSLPSPAPNNPWLERLTAWHAAIFALGASWAFGGNIYWARLPLSVWGTLAAVLTVVGIATRWRHASDRLRPVVWLMPWIGLSLLVLASAANPNHEERAFFDGPILRPRAAEHAWLPSSARPELAVSEWWLLTGLYLTGFNVALNLRSRGLLRGLFGALVWNAALLAVFGTLQKLSGSSGLFFGVQRSPNPTFFASFIYHNHWGAFALLMITAALGLIAHQARQPGPRGFWQSPAALHVAAALLLAATIPLSSSRSCTALLVIVLIVAAWQIHRRIRHSHTSSGGRLRQLLLVIGAGGAAIGAMIWLSAPVLQARWEKTREQASSWREVGGLGGREILYRDTWRMAMDRPWTGWGLESYETVFVRYNSATSPGDRLTVHFDQAHSDWLQALAEIGVLGTTLLLLMGLVPLWSWRRYLRRHHEVTIAVLFGCGLIAAYAWVEFPLANPSVVLTVWILFFGGLRHAALANR